jgi:hypothetical protein
VDSKVTQFLQFQIFASPSAENMVFRSTAASDVKKKVDQFSQKTSAKTQKGNRIEQLLVPAGA